MLCMTGIMYTKLCLRVRRTSLRACVRFACVCAHKCLLFIHLSDDFICSLNAAYSHLCFSSDDPLNINFQ